MFAAVCLIHPSCGGLLLPAIPQPWPVRMLRTPRKEEEEVVMGGGGYIYLSLLHRSEEWSTPRPSDLNGAQRYTHSGLN